MNKKAEKQWYQHPLRIGALQCDFEGGRAGTLAVADVWRGMGMNTEQVFHPCAANGANVWYGLHGSTRLLNTPGGKAGDTFHFLQTVAEVDSERIGSIGHSQGGGITIHAMSVDERIKVGVSSCGYWPARLAKNPFNAARIGWWVGRPLLRPYCWTGKPFPVDLHEHLAMIAPRAIMAITALNDGGYGLDEVARVRPAFENLDMNVSSVYTILGAESNFDSLLHTHGHGFLGEQRAAAYAFLDTHLKPESSTK